jgi:TPR repeat protein
MSLYVVEPEGQIFKLYLEALYNRTKENVYAKVCVDRLLNLSNVDLLGLLLKGELSGSFESIDIYKYISSQKPYDHYDEYAIGEALIQIGKKEEGLAMIKTSAKHGNMLALHRLGNLNFYGDTFLGISTNKVEGIRLFKESANLGFGLAYYNLGYCYFSGDGVTKDRNEGVNYYKKAAHLGCAIAEHKLANCYENATGVEENLQEARKLYENASRKGYGPSTQALESLLERILQDAEGEDSPSNTLENQ